MFFRFLVLIWGSLCFVKLHSFVLRAPSVSSRTIPSSSVSSLNSSLNVFGAFGNFLNSNNNNHRNGTIAAGNMMEPDAAAGTFRLVSLSVETIKPGGLRLMILLYLMGLQNTPSQNTWKADQPCKEDYVLDFWYLPDRSAVLTITLEEDRILIDRVGSDPSTHYLIQEASVVDKILQELETCALDTNVAANDRLLCLEHPNAIEEAREGLAFG